MRQFKASWMLLMMLLHGCVSDGQIAEDNFIPPLIAAEDAGDIRSLDILLDARQPIDTRDACRWTPLMKAARNGHIGIIRRLLQAGASVDLTDNGGYTAMMQAASNNHNDIVELLLKHGANVNQAEQTNGWNALIWAAKQGHVETVDTLLTHGADSRHRDFQGKRAIDWAIEGEHEAVAALLKASYR